MRPTDQNPDFRDRLTAREIPLVLATCNDDLLTSPDGHRRATKVLATIAGVDENGQAGANWERRSIGPYAGGPPEAERDPARPGRARLPSNPADEGSFRPTWPDGRTIRSAGSPATPRPRPPGSGARARRWPHRTRRAAPPPPSRPWRPAVLPARGAAA